MTTSKKIQLEQRIRTAKDYCQVNNAYNDATQWEHTANSIAEAAELLGVDEVTLHDRLIVSEELIITDSLHMVGGHDGVPVYCTVRVWEIYADPGSDDYVYMLEVAGI